MPRKSTKPTKVEPEYIHYIVAKDHLRDHQIYPGDVIVIERTTDVSLGDLAVLTLLDESKWIAGVYMGISYGYYMLTLETEDGPQLTTRSITEYRILGRIVKADAFYGWTCVEVVPSGATSDLAM